MKKILLIVGILFLMMSSCKTTEKNYRTAYEAALVKENDNVDPDIAKKIANEVSGQKVDINGDSVRMKTEFVKLVEGNNGVLPSFGIVVGNFKQIFNARMMMNRFIDKKYPAFIVENRETSYLVIAHGFSNSAEAAKYMKNIKKNIPFPLPITPYILGTGQ